MHAKRFQKAAVTLSTHQGVALVRAMDDQEWHLASQVAAKANVHVSTATKHLSSLYEAGVVERRRTKSKTGRTYAYRLPTRRISLTLDLSADRTRGNGPSLAAVGLIAAAIDHGESLGWKGLGRRVRTVLLEMFPEEMEDCPGEGWEPCLQRLFADGEGVTVDRIIDVLRAVRAAFENAMGSIASERVFLAALDDVEGGSELEKISGDLFFRGEVVR